MGRHPNTPPAAGQGAPRLARHAVEGLLVGLAACTPKAAPAGPTAPTTTPTESEAADAVTVPRPDALPVAPRRAAIAGSGKARCDDADPHAHDCKGMNDCKGLGGCKTDKNDCRGKNECKAQGGCKMGREARTLASHACAGKNECKGLGGCKTDRSSCRGKNDCKGLGGCKTEGAPCE